jgi:DNA-binding beta-propeller fold protein YncE
VDGTLSSKIPPTVATGRADNPCPIAVSADGTRAYLANGGDNTVSQYTITAWS